MNLNSEIRMAETRMEPEARRPKSVLAAVRLEGSGLGSRISDFGMNAANRAIAASVLALFAVPLAALARPLPTLPPAGYDQGGRFPAGSIQWNVSYYSSVAGRNLNMHVYRPPGYNPSQKYGVIYCYQGIGVGADTTFADWSVNAGTVADNLIGEGKIRPVIIVALDNQFDGNGSDVNGMTINDAIPFVDATYSTHADAHHRGVFGYSWGGGHAFNVGCGNLDTFRHIGPSAAAPSKAANTTLFPDGGAEARAKLKTLLIACGTADSLYGTSESAHTFCVANNIPHAWWPIAGAGHWANETWRPHMWNFLQMADAAGISDPPVPRSAFAQNEAEDYDQRRGVIPEDCSEGGRNIGTIENGSYVVFNNVDFGTGALSFEARVASATSGGTIEIRLGSTNGTLLGTCTVPNSGGWQTWITRTNAVAGVAGVHNVYLRFTGGAGYLLNVNWWKFNGPVSPVTPPSTPAALVATPGTERTLLRWNTASGARSYTVKRAEVSGGPFAAIATVGGTNYTDAGVIGGTPYYYVVSAVNLGGESSDSVEAAVTPAVLVPQPWLTRDIGAVGLAGGASFTNGIFTVTGSGADIAGTSDAFRFVSVTNNGDCTIIARVAALESHISPWSKAGVMIRASQGTNAAYAFIGITPGNGATWQFRSTTGGATTSSSISGPSATYWVRLVRSGNTFTGSYSANGTSWTQLGSTAIGMGSTVHVGLAVSSRNLYTLCTAAFDRVTGPGWAPVLPPAPLSLTATAGVERVTLNWMGSAGATSYLVKRATLSGGPYATVATVTSTNYTDTAVVARTTYYYVVSALNHLAGESGNSAQAIATPVSAVPLPWISRDIGSLGLNGSAGYTNGVFTVRGSGADIWGTVDAFRFVYVTTNSTNFSVTARVLSVQNTDPWAKAGVMIRSSLDANSANALIALTPGNGVSFQSRSSAGGGSVNSTSGGLTAPHWVRLVRDGDTFTAFRSLNGVTWTQQGSPVTITMGSTVHVGLAVTAHNNAALCSATFDNVTLPGWPPPLLTLEALALSSTQVGLSWNSVAGATGYSLKRSTVSGGPYASIASGLVGTQYTNSVASVRNGYYYVVTALTPGGETNSPEAAVRFPALTGSVIGTPGSWNNSGNTVDKVFDGDLTSFFDAPVGNGAWAGLDFGAGISNSITRINFCPRTGFESRMVGGVFQGANQPNFADAVTLYSVSAPPASGGFTSAVINNPSAFRYVRYLSPNDGWGNVAEVEFQGYRISPAPPAAMTLALDEANLTLAWPLACEGFLLQSRTNLVSGEWETVTNPAPGIQGEQWRVTFPAPEEGGSVFYRLSK